MKQRTRLMHGFNIGDDLISYNMSKKTDGDVNGEIQLHKMKAPEHFIEAQVQEGDTLQAIALRFRCSIAELKRINHIHKDNEIFARRTLKIPVTPFSVLTELVPGLNSDTAPAPSTSELLQGPNFSINTQIGESSQTRHKEKKDDFEIDCNEVVMNSTLAPAIIPYTDAEPNEPVSEDTQLLPSKPKEPVEAVVVKQLTSQGADFGLKWYHLVGCLLILGVIIPLIYVMFYLKPEHELTVEHELDLPPLHSNSNR